MTDKNVVFYGLGFLKGRKERKKRGREEGRKEGWKEVYLSACVICPTEFEINYLNFEEELAIHSDTLTWEIPWTEEPGRL